MQHLKNLGIYLKKRWGARKKYKTISSMPTILIALCGVLSLVESLASGFVVKEIGPDYLRIVSSTPLASWGWQGTYVTIALTGIVLFSWFFGSLAKRCNSILQRRLFK